MAPNLDTCSHYSPERPDLPRVLRDGRIVIVTVSDGTQGDTKASCPAE